MRLPEHAALREQGPRRRIDNGRYARAVRRSRSSPLHRRGYGPPNNPDNSAPYLRLRTRLESLRDDRRFAFMFSDWLVTRDTLSQIVGRLLRIPVDGRPVTVIDLSGIPSEIADVVVSLVCRLTFDFSFWSDRERRPPVLLVCEEAHRYVPAVQSAGFAAAARAMTRIAREGRTYGVAPRRIPARP